MLNIKWSIILRSISLLFALNTTAQQTAYPVDSKSVYVIGSENIGYYPHYDFINPEQPGYLSSLLQLFAEQQELELVFVALPNRRLHLALEKGEVDFAYPDNPDWGKKPVNPELSKHFSEPITHALGGTIVHNEQRGKGLSAFESLVIPFGFTPIKWQQKIDNNEVRLVQVADAIKALELVQRQRVSGADIEFHVAMHLIDTQPQLTSLSLDPDLPFDIVGFRLSTYHHPALLEQLNSFIGNNPTVIMELKKYYGLRSAETILKTLEKAN